MTINDKLGKILPFGLINDPVRKTKWHVKKLAQYLEIPISAIKVAIVIVNPEKADIDSKYDNQKIKIVRGIDELDSYVNNLANDGGLSLEERDTVINKLKRISNY